MEPSAMQAVQIILDEHRSIAAVLNGMLYLVRNTRLVGPAPPFKVLGAMTYYIDTFAERFHHPKEDAHLFRLLRLRYPNSSELIERLESEHHAGAEKIRDLEQTLKRYEEGGPKEFRAFAATAESYAQFHWDHMRAEEDLVLPLARTHLTVDDWKEIDEAFLSHSDPLFGHKASAHYDELFRQIVHLAPPPIGVGPTV
jgi:hemerythrin-like domain-containing protein